MVGLYMQPNALPNTNGLPGPAWWGPACLEELMSHGSSGHNGLPDVPEGDKLILPFES